MTVTVRQARPDDIGPMSKLLAQLFAIETDFDFNASAQQQGLELLLAAENEAMILVAETAEKVIGMITLQKLISTAEGGVVGLIEDLVIDIAWRGQGIGSKLLAAVEHYAEEHKLCRLQLLADRKNHSALNFYRNQQWASTDLIGLRKIFARHGE